ncbi:MAG: hypothetical protein ACLFVD_00230 [Dehalococcoidia bacterium]
MHCRILRRYGKGSRRRLKDINNPIYPPYPKEEIGGNMRIFLVLPERMNDGF